MSKAVDKIPERDQFTLTICCPNCGQEGSSVWEENNTLNPKGPEPIFVSISAGFYERLSTKIPYPIELVCRRCETVQAV